MKNQFRWNSIGLKITAVIILVLLAGISAVMYVTIDRQKNSLIQSTEDTLAINTGILNEVIRNIMLSGEAPIAVNTMKSLKQITELSEIEIYRVDGTNAFNDYQTIEQVNEFQEKKLFSKTERVKHSMTSNPGFKKVLETNTSVNQILMDTQEMEYLYPIINRPECRECHGYGGFIRGIAHFKISLKGVYKTIDSTRNIVIIFFSIVGIFFAIILILLIRSLLIRPLITIGETVKDVGNGNFDAKVEVKSRDELGDLASQLNDMIKGLKERFHLSKYVSKSTDALVKEGKELHFEGERKYLTVLFSDVRGFTAYSDTRSPSEVIRNLNQVLQVQAEIVEKFHGDIDKYVGDELMAIFKDELQAVECAVELVKAVQKINHENHTELYIGVGINSGEVTAGNIGSKNRLEYAVIGDTVNMASRLCSLAKANMVVVTENTYEKIKDHVEAVVSENQKFKGKSEPVTVYLIKSLKK